MANIDDIDWGALRKAGLNRILVALVWWRTRLGADADGESFVGWQELVKDVTGVLACLTKTYHGVSSEAETSEPAKTTKSGEKRK